MLQLDQSRQLSLKRIRDYNMQKVTGSETKKSASAVSRASTHTTGGGSWRSTSAVSRASTHTTGGGSKKGTSAVSRASTNTNSSHYNEEIIKLIEETIDDNTINVKSLTESLFEPTIRCSKLAYILLGTEIKKYYKIPLYNKYCSDHTPILTVNSETATVYVSFNVEHSGHVLDRLDVFIRHIEIVCQKTLDSVKVDNFKSKIINMKNSHILNLIRSIIETHSDKRIIFNIQEASPSLYVVLSTNLRCRMTKLQNQHLIEVFQRFDNDKIVKLGLRNSEHSEHSEHSELSERTEENIIEIEEYIRDMTTRVPNTYNQIVQGGRFTVNGSFMSFVFEPTVRLEDKDLLDFGLDISVLPINEEEYCRIVLRSNNLPENQDKFLRSRPIMMHTQICNIGSRLLNNGVMLGSFILICRGIHIIDYNTLNFHGHKNSKSTEFLLNGIKRRDLKNIFDIFEHNFEEVREVTVTDKRLTIQARIFEPLLRSFMEQYRNIPCQIDCLTGDLNMKNDDFRKYELANSGTDLSGNVFDTGIDKIISFNIECIEYSPTIHFKILAEQVEQITLTKLGGGSSTDDNADEM